MTQLREPDRIILSKALDLLVVHLPVDQARARLEAAFITKAIVGQPNFAFSYDQAHIDWTTGEVTIPRKRGAFRPTVSRQHIEAYFFVEEPRTLTNAPFARRTIIAAIEVLEAVYKTHDSITRQFLKWGRELNSRCNNGSIKDRFNHLIKFFDEDSGRLTDDGESLGKAIVENAISCFRSFQFGLMSHNNQAWIAFAHALDLSGFAVADGNLIRVLPEELKLPQAQDEITILLGKHGFKTPSGHLEQAFNNHTEGHWASANAQIRSFYESLFDEIAIKIDANAATRASGENRRAFLAKQGFLIEGLNEWSSDGKNFVNGLFKRLHPAGSHPGLSDRDDSTFRLHVVLVTARLMLRRFDTWPGTS